MWAGEAGLAGAWAGVGESHPRSPHALSTLGSPARVWFAGRSAGGNLSFRPPARSAAPGLARIG